GAGPEKKARAPVTQAFVDDVGERVGEDRDRDDREAIEILQPFRHSNRYASSGPFSPSYASCAMRSVKGSMYLAILSGPASTGSKPTSRISSAATVLARSLSPQYARLGRGSLFRASNTSNSTSL